MMMEELGTASEGVRRGYVPSPEWERDVIDPHEVHETLMALARDDAERDFLRGEWMLRGFLAKVWTSHGYGSFTEYCERLFGYAPRTTAERLRVARCLRTLPVLGEGLRASRVNFSVVKEVTRVATADTEHAWLEAVDGKSASEVQAMVSGLELGDRPGDQPRRHAERKVLRFEVNAETKALFDEARTVAMRETGHGITEDEFLRLLVGRYLEGDDTNVEGDGAGRARHQVQFNVCERCGEGDVVTGGREVRVRTAVTEAALCDAHVEADPGVGPEAADAAQADCPRGHGHGQEPPRPRGRQTIPPRTRRAVMRRDKGQCRVPGCRHSAFLDIHHVVPVAEGGNNEPDNLVVLCGNHHVAVHEGRLMIEGAGPEWRFLHADGLEYASPTPRLDPRPRPCGRAPKASRARQRMGELDAYRRASGGLRQLGFKLAEVTAVLASLRQELGDGAGVDAEAVMRAALPRLSAHIVSARDEGPGYRVAA